MSKRLKQAYFDVVSVLRKHYIEVRDAEVDDVDAIFLNRNVQFVIVIGKVGSLRRKFFVLCHEVGHVMYLGKDGLTMRKRVTRDESAANRIACKLIGFLDKKLVKVYEKYYNDLNKNSCRARFKA